MLTGTRDTRRKSLTAAKLCIAASGIFLMTGLLTGLWKYLCMHGSAEAEAPYYVNIAHRAALMYSFAALVMAELAVRSAWSPVVNFWAAAVPLAFFALAIGTYILHGVLRDTDNQLRRPHRLGSGEVPAWSITAFMLALAVGEIGGVGILLLGFLAAG